MWQELQPYLPTDSSAQFSAAQYAARLAPSLPPGAVVMDLGCGSGVSIDLFRRIAPQAKWLGVDIEHSPEVDSRTRGDAEFRSYNGVDLPAFPDAIDMIYSRQVFEHVRYPEKVLEDIGRVLKPGGVFIGSTSHLEPYHSFSFWNFTPFGFKRLVDAVPTLELIELRPGIDAITLITRAYRNNDPEMNRWFGEESPMNLEIEDWARERKHSVQATAYRKLAFCGQFAFWVRKKA
ncbi:class I SAM-dependent methyltransferase [uncultured Stenotrophomonas sp.]|uniref:class I SAM-dependent methyltransferase n=1 Tax=uncultured Stenotrophomonas sp. TaxID=165438 RepID=UPI0025D209BC|nr:class I SAM-dependent methyltransferase [uncultured Stenotrophomonas sp.]